MRAKAVTQRMRRDIRDAGMRGVRLDYCPGSLPRHRSTPVQKQLRLSFIAELLADRGVPLQPVDRTFPDRNAPLFAAFAMTGNQGRIDVDVEIGRAHV